MKKAIFPLLILLLAVTNDIDAQISVDGSEIDKYHSAQNAFVGPADMTKPGNSCYRMPACKTAADKLYQIHIQEVNSTCRVKKIKLECCSKGKPYQTLIEIKPTNPKCRSITSQLFGPVKLSL